MIPLLAERQRILHETATILMEVKCCEFPFLESEVESHDSFQRYVDLNSSRRLMGLWRLYLLELMLSLSFVAQAWVHSRFNFRFQKVKKNMNTPIHACLFVTGARPLILMFQGSHKMSPNTIRCWLGIEMNGWVWIFRFCRNSKGTLARPFRKRQIRHSNCSKSSFKSSPASGMRPSLRGKKVKKFWLLPSQTEAFLSKFKIICHFSWIVIVIVRNLQHDGFCCFLTSLYKHWFFNLGLDIYDECLVPTLSATLASHLWGPSFLYLAQFKSLQSNAFLNYSGLLQAGPNSGGGHLACAGCAIWGHRRYHRLRGLQGAPSSFIYFPASRHSFKLLLNKVILKKSYTINRLIYLLSVLLLLTNLFNSLLTLSSYGAIQCPAIEWFWHISKQNPKSAKPSIWNPFLRAISSPRLSVIWKVLK